MFGAGRPERGRDRTTAGAADNHAVRGAEAIVGRAWELELRRQYDRMLFTVRTAEKDRAAAVKALAEAQRDGGAAEIEAALAALARAVETDHKCSIAADRIRLSVRTELDLLNQAAQARAAADLAGAGSVGSDNAAFSRASPPPLPDRVGNGRETPVAPVRRRGLSRWIDGMAAWRAARRRPR